MSAVSVSYGQEVQGAGYDSAFGPGSPQIVEALKSSQLEFEHVYAEFDLLCEGVPRYTANRMAPVIEPVTGSLIWARNGDAQRISIRFDLDPEQQTDPFFQRDLVVRGSRQVEVFVRTRQALVLDEPSLLIKPTPAEIFLGGTGHDLATMEQRGGIVRVAAEGESNPLEILLPGEGDRRVRVTAGPESEYHVTAWTRADRGRSAQIEWRRDSDGILIPSRAVWTEGTVEGGEQRWTLTTRSFSWGSPPAEEIDLPIPTGTIVADYFESTEDGKAVHYMIGADGQRKRIFVHNRLRLPTSARTKAMVGGSVALIVLVGAFLRLRGR